MRLPDLCPLVILPLLVSADVVFVSPAAGTAVDVGTIQVTWKESGKAPPISDLTQYTLSLMVGGNEQDNMLQLAPFESNGQFSAGNNASGTIPAGIASSIKDGFFFQMKSAASQGGEVIDYSDRFSINGLEGSTPSKYVNAVKALQGSTNGPPTVRNVTGLPSASASTSLATATTSSPAFTKTVHAKPTPTSATSPTPSAKDGHSLPLGGVIGVVIACTLVAAGLLAALVYFFVRHRRNKKQRGQGPFFQDYKAELSGVELSQQRLNTGVSGMSHRWPPVEISDGSLPPEMDSMAIRAELEGDSAHGEFQGSPVISPVPEGSGTPRFPDSPAVSPIVTENRSLRH